MSEEKQDKILALHQFSNDVMQVWSRTDEIRKLFCHNLTEIEFKFFCGMGIALGANPFKREIWNVKYDKTKPAAIFTGRDFARKKAQEQPDYDGHIADAVYSNDDFTVETGIPNHKYKLKDRGELLGAYFLGHRKSISKPFYLYVNFSEYDKQQSLWKTIPVTMIKKVAEAQGCRMMFQGVFAGTYDESEAFDNSFEDAEVLGPPIEMPTAKGPIDKVETAPADTKKPPEIKKDDVNAGRFAQWSELQDEEITIALNDSRDAYKKNKERMAAQGFDNIGKVLAQFGVKSLSPTDMTPEQYWRIYDHLIGSK